MLALVSCVEAAFSCEIAASCSIILLISFFIAVTCFVCSEIFSVALQRYKGLGEMDANQLWETTLNPETRILAQVSLSDTVEADEVTTLLMGSNVPPRRAFIIEEAKYAKLDI